MQGPLIISAFGFDPGLNHGTIVQSKFLFSPNDMAHPELIEWEVVFEWKKTDELSLVSYSDPYQVARLNNAIFSSLKGRPVATWGIERDVTAGYWGTAQQDAILNFFLGYIYRGLLQIGCPVIWLTPSSVRGKLSVPRSAKKAKGKSGKLASKAEVWKAVAGVIRGTKLKFPWDTMDDDPEGDIRDAFVLSFLAAQGAAVVTLAQSQIADTSKQTASESKLRS